MDRRTEPPRNRWQTPAAAATAALLAVSGCAATVAAPDAGASARAGGSAGPAGAAPSAVGTSFPPAAGAGSAPTADTSAAPTPRLKARRLAAAVMFGCADSGDGAAQRAMARAGIGGIVLLGSNPPADLGSRLRSVRAAAPAGWQPVIASDEEGGTVQRLAPLIYRLPPAETMGTWPDRKIRRTAKRYGTRMLRLGVTMSLAPVADLRVPGSYIDRLGRAFSSDPERVGRAVSAWSRGLRAAEVIPVVKHWPGHGHAADTHTQAARVPPLSQLRNADLVPFGTYTAAGNQAIMVAHVQSAGLTKAGVPATQSPRAIRVLRRQAGPDAVIITDSLSMAAATSARGLSQSQAVVAALRAGVDWAMVCTASPRTVIAAVARAIRADDLDRGRLEQSLARIRSLTGG